MPESKTKATEPTGPDPTPEPVEPGLDPETEPGLNPEALGRGPRNDTGLPNVHQAIAEAMRLVRAVGKWGQNKEQNYKFRSIDDFMTALNPAMAKAGVHIVPTVLQRITDDSHTTSNNKVMRWVDVEMRFRIFGPAGDFVDVITWGEARDSADKGTNKAMTGAFKYAVMQAFMVPTQDLEDADQSSPEVEPVRQEARAERRQAERQQAPRVADGVQIAAALKGASTKTDMGQRLAALPGALVVENSPGRFAYDSKRLREIDVVLDEGEGDTMSAWEAIGIFGASLPDAIEDPAEPEIPEPPQNTQGPAQRLHAGDPDPEGDLWAREDAERQQQAEGRNEEPGR